MSVEPLLSDVVKNCIDMDEWKHSWHLDVSRIYEPDSVEYQKCLDIIVEKMNERIEELYTLQTGLLRLHHLKNQ